MQQLPRVDMVLNEITLVKTSLSNKKKYTPMKEALTEFLTLMQQNKKDGTFVISRNDIQKLLQPAQNQLRSAKFHITLICFLLKLINLKVLNDINSSEDVLLYFLKIKDIQKEQLQLKLIQSFMTLIHPEFIHFGNYGFVEKCLTMVLHMKCSKNPIINSSAESSLYRVIELLSASTQLIIGNKGTSFEGMEIQVDIEDETKESSKKPEQVSPVADNKQVNNLQSILLDFISISDYIKPTWYPQQIPLDRELGLASINSFLSNMGKFFMEYKQIAQVLQVSLITVLKKIVATPTNMIRTSIIVEAYKCMIILVDINPLVFIDIWSTIIGQIQGEHSIQRNLAFQSLIYLVQSQLFIDNLLKLGFGESNFILDIITTISGLAKSVNDPNEVEFKRWNEFNNPTINLQSGNVDVQISDNAFICRMIAEFQQRLIQSICVYADNNKIILGNAIQVGVEHQTIIQLMEHIWKLNLRALKYLLMKDVDELTLQSILSGVQSYILVIGSLQMRVAQSAFIKTICEFCKPKVGQDFTKRYIQINKMVLNIANCLGNLLECSSWVCILKTFEECENHYLRNRLARNSSQEEQSKTLDITILFQSLDQIFTQSSTYQIEHLLTIMDAINQITIECLEVNGVGDFEAQKKKPNEPKSLRIFSLTKLVDLIKFNLDRLDLYWELIMAHFVSVVSSKNLQLVQGATETLSQIIFLGFEYLTIHHKKGIQKGFIKDKWSKDESTYQMTLFQPWVYLCAIRQVDVKEIILNYLFKMLQNNGHEIAERGWDGVILILFEISNEQTTNYIKLGLANTEYIINQFLSQMSQQQISKLFDIIDNLKQNSNEQNVNFQICNMLWHLGDFITKNSAQPCQRADLFLPKIFYKLSQIALDQVPEIRHSAIHIFCNLLMHLNTDQDNLYTEWKRIMEQFLLEMIHRVVHIFQDKNAAKENDVLQWEETAKSAFQSFIKLVKKYFMIVDDVSTNKDQDAQIIIQAIVPDIIIVFQQNKSQLSLEVAKQVRELFQFKSTICLQNFGGLLDQISTMYNSPPQDIKYLKTLIMHITNEILELLTDIIKMASEVHIQKVLEIYYKILEFPLIAHMLFDLIQNKIFFEDNLAPKNFMMAIQYSIQKTSPLFMSEFTHCILYLLQDPPTNKYKHILIRRHLTQLNSILLGNAALLFNFSELYNNLIHKLRNGIEYLQFQEVLNEDKSIWYTLADCYLETAKKHIQEQKITDENHLKLLGQLQNTLPSSPSLIQIYTSGTQELKNSISEQIYIQDIYVKWIAQQYIENAQLVESKEYVQFINIVHDLCLTGFESSITPIAILGQLTHQSDIRTPLSLPHLLDIAVSILDGNSKQQLLALLECLLIVEIPINAMNQIKLLNNQVIQFNNTNHQCKLGHLIYLMPSLSSQIISEDNEVRQALHKVMLKLSQILI